MKICSKCRQKKPFEEFNFKNKQLDARQSSCKTCTRSEIKRHYDNNKEYYLKKAKLRNRENKILVKKYIWNYLLKHPCIDCGINDPIVLDFDHQKGKIDNVSELVRQRQSLNKIIKEIEKCVVRCANCHRRKTARDFAWFGYDMPL